MQIVIDIPNEGYDWIKNGFPDNEDKEFLIKAVKNGIPYEEKTQGDTISREALKKVIAEKATFIDGDSVYKIIDLIDNAPTVENITVFCENADEKSIADLKEELQKVVAEKRPQGKWIPVSERLPEKEDFYLVFLENEQMVVAHSSGIIANHDFEPKMLAWQPLPEPYMEEGAE